MGVEGVCACVRDRKRARARVSVFVVCVRAFVRVRSYMVCGYERQVFDRGRERVCLYA